MRYQIIAFGCQFNKSDAERVTTVLEKLGYKKASKQNEPDLILILACSVRQSGIDRIYGLERKFEQIRKTRPLITILSGCVLKSDLPKMKKIFDLVFDIKDLPKLPKLLKVPSSPPATLSRSECGRGKFQVPNYLKIKPSYHSNFQASVPIIIGCDNFCSYCVVPYVRGREVSLKAKGIVRECQNLISQGYKEIILIGQNVNSYKDDKTDFPKLLKMVDEISGDYWLSFTTSHPKDISDKLIKAMAEGKHIIPYLHLPVQSGDNQILKKMNRGYTVSHYKKLIKKVRKAVPMITISTDIIVGFSGETRQQFNNAVKLLEEVKFDMAYISQYSERAGTGAARLEDNVPKLEKKRREKVLTNVLKRTALEENKKLISQTVEVLVEEYKDGFCFGKTNTLKNIKFISDIDRTGEIVLVKVINCYAWGLAGELPKVVVVLGTTASGKTKLAVKLAKKFNGEIISADSRQVYKGMDVGTGKDLGEYDKVPYHLIDVADPKSQFTVAQWQKQALEAIDDILKRGKLPIVCGGTGLYISALVEGYNLEEIRNQRSRLRPSDFGGQAEIRNKLHKLSLKQLLARLKKIDPETYEVIDKKNRRRVQRALEIYYETGVPKSKQQKKQKPPYDFLQIGATFSKDVLHKRIEKRLKHRIFNEGMVEEVKRLKKSGVSWKRLDEFGLEYRWVAKYLQGKINKEELLEELSRAIKNFAKRQITWFKRDKRVVWENNFKKTEGLVRIFLQRKN